MYITHFKTNLTNKKNIEYTRHIHKSKIIENKNIKFTIYTRK